MWYFSHFQISDAFSKDQILVIFRPISITTYSAYLSVETITYITIFSQSDYIVHTYIYSMKPWDIYFIHMQSSNNESCRDLLSTYVPLIWSIKANSSWLLYSLDWHLTQMKTYWIIKSAAPKSFVHSNM